MSNRDLFPRRRVLKSAVAMGSLVFATPVRAAIPPFTPNQVMGPFYPVEKPLDQDSDLTIIAGDLRRFRLRQSKRAQFGKEDSAIL